MAVVIRTSRLLSRRSSQERQVGGRSWLWRRCSGVGQGLGDGVADRREVLDGLDAGHQPPAEIIGPGPGGAGGDAAGPDPEALLADDHHPVAVAEVLLGSLVWPELQQLAGVGEVVDHGLLAPELTGGGPE